MSEYMAEWGDALSHFLQATRTMYPSPKVDQFNLMVLDYVRGDDGC